MPDIEPTPPSALRRHRRAQAGLVAAAPVRSMRVVQAGTAGIRVWPISASIAVAIVIALSGTMLATGFGTTTLPTLGEAQNLRAGDPPVTPCTLPAAAEASGFVHNPDACDETDEPGDFPGTTADGPKSDPTPEPRASGQPHTDDARSEPVAPNAPAPRTSTQPTPNSPAPDSLTPSDPSRESASTPGPAPGRAPVPAPAPAPAPADPTPPVHVPKSLAFTNLTENHAIGLLGIRLLSSYTLSLSGEPGSTAAVWYDGRNEGSVKFNSSGRASITIGKSLLSLGPGSTLIRAAYSDGTSGNDIQARRDSI